MGEFIAGDTTALRSVSYQNESDVNFDEPRGEGRKISEENEGGIDDEQSNQGKGVAFLSEAYSTTRVCCICGDKAISCNFGVLSCKSCKAFFRRMLSWDKELNCVSDNNCAITVTERRRCPKCRLRKCFEVGMKLKHVTRRKRRNPNRDTIFKDPQEESSRPSMRDDSAYSELAASLDGTNGYLSATRRHAEPMKIETPALFATCALPAQHHIEMEMPLLTRSASENVPAAPTTYEIGLVAPALAEVMRNAITANEEEDYIMMTAHLPISPLFDIALNNGNNDAMQIVSLPEGTTSWRLDASAFNTHTQSGCFVPVNNVFTFGAAQQQHNHQPGAGYYDSQQNASYRTPVNQSTPGTSQYQFVTEQDVAELPLQNLVTDGDLIDKLSSNLDFDSQDPLLSPNAICLQLKYVKLDELLIANEKCYRTCKPPSLMGGTTETFTDNDMFQIVHHGISRTVKKFSHLSALRNLPWGDQVALIRGSYQEVALLSGLARYDAKTGRVASRHAYERSLGFDLFKRVRRGIHNEVMQLVVTYPEKYRHNESLMLIITALLLFNPNCSQLHNKKVVEQEWHVYLQLLKDYLETTYGVKEARWTYRFFLNWVDVLRSFMKSFGCEAPFEISPRNYDLMLFEFFNVE